MEACHRAATKDGCLRGNVGKIFIIIKWIFQINLKRINCKFKLKHAEFKQFKILFFYFKMLHATEIMLDATNIANTKEALMEEF
jgi:hypothetical protein